MITTITLFTLPKGTDLDLLRASFAEAASLFEAVPGLVRKQFLISEDGRTAGGVYLWNDREAAETFLITTVAPLVLQNFGVEPVIQYYETPVVVEAFEAAFAV